MLITLSEARLAESDISIKGENMNDEDTTLVMARLALRQKELIQSGKYTIGDLFDIADCIMFLYKRTDRELTMNRAQILKWYPGLEEWCEPFKR